MDQIWHFISEHLSGEFGKGFATVIGSLIIGWLTKDWAVVALATIFKNKKRAISAEHWHTAFLQNGALKIESAKLKSIPFVRQYIGVVKYRKPGKSDVSHYAFAGQLSEGFFTATYKSEEEGINDYGAWMLKLSDDGTAMVGAYVWIVKDGEIGHDFYQWTETDLEGLNSPMTGTLDVQRVEQFLTSLPTYFKGSFGPAGIPPYQVTKTKDLFSSPGFCYLQGHSEEDIWRDYAILRNAEPNLFYRPSS